MNLQHLFHGPNAGYILEQYERFSTDPESVDQSLRLLFQHWSPPTPTERAANNGVALTQNRIVPRAASAPTSADVTVAGAANLANAIRDFGHLAAQIDPLGGDRPGDPMLSLTAYQLSEAELSRLPSAIIGDPIAGRTVNALEAVVELRRVYTGSTGYDIAHIHDPQERAWLREAIESQRYHPANQPLDAVALLERLTQVEGFEQFLHTTFQGKKRFSIEGLDVMVPMLDEIIGEASRQEIYHVLIGMAHRGRLNVLTHVMQKPYQELLVEFKDVYSQADVNWTGDVKYHFGYLRRISGKVNLTVEMADNPSHLELVAPVIAGMARAAGSNTAERGQVEMDPLAVMPLLIHGDAAFAGQGIVPETLNLSRLPGWRVGGTIHLIANNQIGFTANETESRSTLYASDIAKGFEIPIVHVNADDVEACIEVARLAMEYQTRFEKDFLIDLVGYRRYGHNEGDEPRFTQPEMYKRVETHPTVRSLYAGKLVERGLLQDQQADAMLQRQMDRLTEINNEIDAAPVVPKPFEPSTHVYRRWETQLDAELLRQYNQELLNLPQTFTMHRGLQRVFKRRADALDDADQPNIDWGHAESLAFASILAEGTPIRITGQDAERGTFSQRHAVLHDLQSGERYIPLQQLPQAQATFECRNSALSENAAVGFEYGYSLRKPTGMTLWEAQFGDFVNGAQPTLDEFLMSGNAKWGHVAPLVLLLPHGYEGQGPDHSSARLERFLMMAADRNVRIVYPTTAAQYYHLLRRHMLHLQADPRPLIVMSPKSLLRHPLARSSLLELANGYFQPVIDDPTVDEQRRSTIQRVALCSGKIYVDTVSSELRPDSPAVALVRVEQLYRFPLEEVQAVIAAYPNATEVVWLQEEPKNGASWRYVEPLLRDNLSLPLSYIGRPNRASPSEGSLFWHKANQDAIIKSVYNLE